MAPFQNSNLVPVCHAEIFLVIHGNWKTGMKGDEKRKERSTVIVDTEILVNQGMDLLITTTHLTHPQI